MKRLIDIVNESELVCEAFKNKYIYQAWKTLTDKGVKWKNITKHATGLADIRWSEIKDEDVEVVDIEDIEDELVKMRRLKAGKDTENYLVLGFKDEQLKCIFVPLFTDIYVVVFGDVHHYSMDSDRNYMPQRGQIDILKSCDYLVKVYISKYGAQEMTITRRKNREGSWELTPQDHKSKHLSKGVLGRDAGGFSEYVSYSSFYGMCQRMANLARDKWKRILAERKLADTDTTKVDDAVKGIMDRLPKLTKNITSDPKKYNVSGYDMERIMRKIYGKQDWDSRNRRSIGENELLYLYGEYCATIVNVRTNYGDKDYLLKQRNSLESKILAKCIELDVLFKKFDA